MARARACVCAGWRPGPQQAWRHQQLLPGPALALVLRPDPGQRVGQGVVHLPRGAGLRDLHAVQEGHRALLLRLGARGGDGRRDAKEAGEGGGARAAAAHEVALSVCGAAPIDMQRPSAAQSSAAAAQGRPCSALCGGAGISDHGAAGGQARAQLVHNVVAVDEAACTGAAHGAFLTR